MTYAEMAAQKMVAQTQPQPVTQPQTPLAQFAQEQLQAPTAQPAQEKKRKVTGPCPWLNVFASVSVGGQIRRIYLPFGSNLGTMPRLTIDPSSSSPAKCRAQEESNGLLDSLVALAATLQPGQRIPVQLSCELYLQPAEGEAPAIQGPVKINPESLLIKQ